MSNTTTAAALVPVANLAEAKKELAAAKKAHPAGKAPAKTPAKAPAKKAPANAAEKKAEAKEAETFEATATGRGGKTNVRKVPTEVHFAVDVADPDGRTPAAKAGLIFRFFSSQEKAEEFAAKKNADGLDAIVVAATSEEVK